jgi:NitT/TauT family transport system permease protein
MSMVRANLPKLIGPLLLIIAWQMLLTVNADFARFLPSPLATAREAANLLGSAAFGADFLATFGRWAGGFVLAVCIGAPTGLILGASTWMGNAFGILVDFFRSLPVTASFPIFLVFLGIGNAAMIAMVCFSTIFIQMMHAMIGVRTAPAARRIMARSFGATDMQIFFRIRSMEAVQQVIIGMRTTLSLSLIVAIVSEMFIGADHGMGQRLYLSYQLQSLAKLYAIVLMVGLLGYAANILFSFVERRFTT